MACGGPLSWFRICAVFQLTQTLDRLLQFLDARALSVNFGLETADFYLKLLECVLGSAVTGAAKDEDDESYQEEGSTTEGCFLVGFYSCYGVRCSRCTSI